MSLKGEENSTLTSSKLTFLLALAGRIDAQSRIVAQNLDKNKSIYHAYAVLDSLSSSYSMFKYFIDVYFAKNDPEFIHSILTSPAGIAGIITETTFLVSFALLASIFDGEEKNATKKFIATAWPYFRDVIKGLKNAYKGWRSSVQILSFISGADLKYLVIPVGLGLGIFSSINRFWLRSMGENRKKLMSLNKSLYLEIQQLDSMTEEEREIYLAKIGYQNQRERYLGFVAAAAGGLIDGLYLYLGVINLSILSPPLFIAMATISAFYILSCIVTRIYEEYDFQRRLAITQTKCKIMLVAKEMETTFANLLVLQENINPTQEDIKQIKALETKMCQLIQQLEERRELLHKQVTYNQFTAIFIGMRYGLYAYGALASFLFMVASVFLATGAAFPPVLLVSFILSGLILMTGMAIFTFRAHYLHLQQQDSNNEDARPYEQLKEMKKNLEMQNDAKILTADSFEESLKAGVGLDPSPQFFFQEWFEVFRSIASGVSKGNNYSNFITTPFQDADPHEHQENPVFAVLAILSSMIFSVVLGLRALARGLSRQAKAMADLYQKIDVPTTTSLAKIKAESSKDDSSLHSSFDSLPLINSSPSLSGFCDSPKSLPSSFSSESSFGYFVSLENQTFTLPPNDDLQIESVSESSDIDIDASVDSLPRTMSVSSIHRFFSSPNSSSPSDTALELIPQASAI